MRSDSYVADSREWSALWTLSYQFIKRAGWLLSLIAVFQQIAQFSNLLDLAWQMLHSVMAHIFNTLAFPFMRQPFSSYQVDYLTFVAFSALLQPLHQGRHQSVLQVQRRLVLQG